MAVHRHAAAAHTTEQMLLGGHYKTSGPVLSQQRTGGLWPVGPPMSGASPGSGVRVCVRARVRMYVTKSLGYSSRDILAQYRAAADAAAVGYVPALGHFGAEGL